MTADIGEKYAGWLEHYAETMEIPVWTSSTVTHAYPVASGCQDKKWHVDVKRGDGSERHFTVNHLVFATGFGGNVPRSFDYPGLDKFKGQYLHSTQHKEALDHAGKKVVVVGAATSAYDITNYYYDHGVDVTMIQRGPTYVMSSKDGWGTLFKGGYWEGGPPVDLIDLLKVNDSAKILQGLRDVGFKLYDGVKGTEVSLLAATGGGGFYIDVGASQLIIDKKIKLKSDSTISDITETGLKFADGSELLADVIIFATGLGDAWEVVRGVCGDTIANKTKPIWNLDAEGESNSVWRDTGIPNMWYAFGNLAVCRFNSKHPALQIKAIEEDIFGERYTLEKSQ